MFEVLTTVCKRCSSPVFHSFRRSLSTQQNNDIQKVLKVGVVGTPNAGKSTLINGIVGTRVSAVSEIKHTTRTHTNGIISVDNTQIIFSDTPGIVNYMEARRLKMDRAHIRAPRRVVGSVDLLAVIQDVSDRSTRNYIDECILKLLEDNPKISPILVLNKIDKLERKTDLIPIASTLMTNRQRDQWGYEDFGGSDRFRECFMVSALTGDGVDDLLSYFIEHAHPGEWEYSGHMFTDASVEFHISEVFREKLLVLFAQEIPWQVKQETEFFQTSNEAVRIHQKLSWPKKSQSRYVESRLDELLPQCIDELTKMFQRQVALTIDISTKKNMRDEDLKYY